MHALSDVSLPSTPPHAFADLCERFDPLLSGALESLGKAARTDLRAFARLFDLALEEADDAEVWRAVRLRLQQDFAPEPVLEQDDNPACVDAKQAA